MSGDRMRRVDEAMRGVLSAAITSELKDPRVGFVTVTAVDTSPDLRQARVYVSVLGTDAERRRSLDGLRSGRLWLALLACLTTSGGVLAAYSYIAPILTDQAGIPARFVPLVLTGFGIGSFAGTLLGGRFGDAHPGLVTILTPAVSTLLIALIAVTTAAPAPMVVLVVLLGLFGLSANGVLIHLAVHHASRAAPMGSALAVSAFNASTAISTPIAGAALSTSLGIHGPSAIGAIIIALTLVPTVALAIRRRRDSR